VLFGHFPGQRLEFWMLIWPLCFRDFWEFWTLSMARLLAEVVVGDDGSEILLEVQMAQRSF
jgi:hypothetical protein